MQKKNFNTYNPNKWQTPAARPHLKDNFHGRTLSKAPAFTLHVSNLSERVTNKELQEVLETYCPGVKKAEIIVDPSSGKSKRFGFVSWYKEADLQTVLSKVKGGIHVEGFVWKVERAKGNSFVEKFGVVKKSDSNVYKAPSSLPVRAVNRTQQVAQFNKFTARPVNNKTANVPQMSVNKPTNQYRPLITTTSRRDHDRPIHSTSLTSSSPAVLSVTPSTSFANVASQYGRSAATSLPHSSSVTAPSAGSLKRLSNSSDAPASHKRPRSLEPGECDDHFSARHHDDVDSLTTLDDTGSSSSSGGESGASGVKWNLHFEPY